MKKFLIIYFITLFLLLVGSFFIQENKTDKFVSSVSPLVNTMTGSTSMALLNTWATALNNLEASTTLTKVVSLPNLATIGTIGTGVWNGTDIDISNYTNLGVTATGLTLSGDDIALTSGYNIPLTASTTNWNTAYDWGNHTGLYDSLGQATSTLSSHTTAFNHTNYNTAYSSLFATGTAGMVLQTNGTIPYWAAGGSESGTVASGTTGYIPFYESYSNTVTPTSTLNLLSSEKVRIGTTDSIFSSAKLLIASNYGTRSDIGNFLFSNNGTTEYPTIMTGRARGTMSAYSSVSPNDILGAYTFIGHDGLSWKTYSEIRSVVDASSTTTSNIIFSVFNSSNLESKMTIHKNGVSIPYASSTALSVSGNSYLGTVSSGSWNGSAIGAQYGGTGSTTLSGLLLGNGTGVVQSVTNNSANWDTAYGWGNHASQGYMTTAYATSIYQPLGTYISQAYASSTYQLKGDYITSAYATSTYVNKANASTTLLSVSGQSWFTGTLNAVAAVLTGLWDFTAGILRINHSTTSLVSNDGDIAIRNDKLIYKDNSATSTLINYQSPSFSYATSTAFSGTTTIPLGVAWEAETWSDVRCFSDTGTLNVQFGDGTNKMNLFNASTTVGNISLTTNNTFTASEKRYVDIGTPASTPTKISCTIKKKIDPN